MSADADLPGEVVELELPPRPEVVSVARLVIGALVASDPLFDDERGADLRLAVSEACTNAIQAQMALADSDADARNAATESIVMRCTMGDGHIEISVTDHGGGFDPAELPAHPAITDPARLEYEGGLGIPLITMLADSLEFEETESGTTLTMRFEPRTPGPQSVLGGDPSSNPPSNG